MLTTKYIGGTIGMLINIFFLPLDEMMKLTLVICVVIFTLIFNLFFFWQKLQDVFIQSVTQRFLTNLYKNEDFVEFLAYRQKRKVKHEEAE